MKKLILVILFLLIPIRGWGATVYCKNISGTVYYDNTASSCDDVTNEDTSGDLEAALSAAGASGMCYICNGTYTGTEIDSDSMLHFRADGQTIQGESRSGVILKGHATKGSGANNVVYADDKSNITLKDLTICHSSTSGQGVKIYANSGNQTGIMLDNLELTANGYTGGVQIESVAPYTIAGTIQNCYSHNNDGNGLSLKGHINGWTVQNNTVINNGDNDNNKGRHGISVGSITVRLNDGISWALDAGNVYYANIDVLAIYRVMVETNGSERKLIENDGAGNGVSSYEWDYIGGATDKLYVNLAGVDPDTLTIAYCITLAQDITISGNTISETHDEDGSEGHGIALDGFGYQGIVKHNIIYSNGGSGCTNNFWDDVQFLSNVIYSNTDNGIVLLNPGDGCKIYNNTINNNSLHGIFMKQGKDNVFIKNNIITNHTALSPSYSIRRENVGDTLINDYNDFYGNDNNPGLSNVTQGDNSITANPLFIDVSGGNFTLQSGSPCVNVGADLGSSYDDALGTLSVWPDGVYTKPQGTLWDIGAYHSVAETTDGGDLANLLARIDYLVPNDFVCIYAITENQIWSDSGTSGNPISIRFRGALTGTFEVTGNYTDTYNSGREVSSTRTDSGANNNWYSESPASALGLSTGMRMGGRRNMPDTP